MKKFQINLTSSLFILFFSLNLNALPLKEGYSNPLKPEKVETPKEEQIDPALLVQDPELEKEAQFSCLKFAAMRLGNEMSLRITQIKPPKLDDQPQFWFVVGNKINQEDEERPISFSCKMTPSDSILWNLEDFNVFQVSKEAVEELKKIPVPEN